MRPATVLVAALFAAALATGCGSSSSSAPEAPNEQQAGAIGQAQLAIPMACLRGQNGTVDESVLSDNVDTIISAYNDHGATQQFSIAPGGPKTSMKQVMARARDALRACDQAGVSTTASQLATRIEAKLDE